jgi:hypothetical protein
MSSANDSGAAANKDFGFVLKAFLGAYRPLLEDELKLARSAETLLKASKDHPPSYESEIKLARTLFERFFTPEVATRLLPDEGRATFGKPNQWAWCHRHILCCMVFGWLVCRGPRTFRGFAYYLYQYWRCVREALGQPVSDPPTIDEKRDFGRLVRILVSAYAPSIQSQIKDLEYPVDIPKEIESDQIGYDVDDNAVNAVFERLLTAEAAPALFGSAAYAEYGNEPIARSCRCYCISALEFGCCLARAHTLIEAVECLEQFFARNRRCFEPIIAELDTPPTCSTLTFVAACSNLAGIEIIGTAAGAAFTSYTLSYNVGAATTNTAVVYPDCSRPPVHPSASTPVTAGVLGYLDIGLLPPTTTQATVYLDVYGSGGLHLQVSAVFQFAINAIEIAAVAEVPTAIWQDPFNASPSIIKMLQNVANPTVEQSIGGSVSVTGSAYAFGCGMQMTQYQLALFGPATFPAPGNVTLPAPAPSPTALGGTPLINPVIYDGTSAHPWSSVCFLSATPNTKINGDLVAVWTSENCWVPFPPPFGSTHPVPTISSNGVWPSGVNGRYVIFLEVDEAPITLPHTPVVPAGEDKVVVWIDNYPVVGAITQIGNVIGCGDLKLSDFYVKGGPNIRCPVIGLAWDYLIDITAPHQIPNDNFDSYSLTYQQNGGSPQNFLAADYAPNGTAGTPTVRVPLLWQATAPTLAQVSTLALWDIVMALDGGTAPDPTKPCIAAKPWQLPRGCHCAYVITLGVGDTTRVGDGGDNHSALVNFAINVINDIA